MQEERIYLAIDLKSFYASVECVARGLDPLTAHLVVADESRTEKTICLAVSPALKAYGVPGRARLFEALEKQRQVNAQRLLSAPGGVFSGYSHHAPALAADPSLGLKFLIAPPRMACYMEVSTRIFGIYSRFVSPEDIHVYSIDEVFIDVTGYLKTYACTAHQLALRMVKAVLRETGITATCGIGTNLYLAKIAMDIVAKHMPADQDGVRIAELNEMTYRQQLWDHQPLTDFWRIGRGYARRLESVGIRTMGDVARCSLGPPYSPYGEEKLFRLFGVNAELLIDHAWGREMCTIRDIKQYVPQDHSLSVGQVLQQPYEKEQALIVIREMLDSLVLQLVDKGLLTDQIAVSVGYDRESLRDPARRAGYQGPVENDPYGRPVPKPAHGAVNLVSPTSSGHEIAEAAMAMCQTILHPQLLVRRIYVVAGRLIPEDAPGQTEAEQMDLFTDYAARERQAAARAREHDRQMAVLKIQKKFGKNALLRGTNFLSGATARQRNSQIGGHRA